MGPVPSGPGWMARARRLPAEERPSAVHGCLAIEDAKRAADIAATERTSWLRWRWPEAMRATPDIERIPLAQLGRGARAAKGQVDDGTAPMDEAMTAALGGDRRPARCGDAYARRRGLRRPRTRRPCDIEVRGGPRVHGASPLHHPCSRGAETIVGAVLVRSGRLGSSRHRADRGARAPPAPRDEARGRDAAARGERRPSDASRAASRRPSAPARRPRQRAGCAIPPLVGLQLASGETTELAAALLAVGDEEDGSSAATGRCRAGAAIRNTAPRAARPPRPGGGCPSADSAASRPSARPASTRRRRRVRRADRRRGRARAARSSSRSRQPPARPSARSPPPAARTYSSIGGHRRADRAAALLRGSASPHGSARRARPSHRRSRSCGRSPPGSRTPRSRSAS